MIDRPKLTVWMHEILEGLTKNEVIAILKHRHRDHEADIEAMQVTIDGILMDWVRGGFLARAGDRFAICNHAALRSELEWIQQGAELEAMDESE